MGWFPNWLSKPEQLTPVKPVEVKPPPVNKPEEKEIKVPIGTPPLYRWGPMRTQGAPLLCVPTPGAIQGIDVSHYQPRVNWAKVKDKGFKFCFAKAGDGNSATATPMLKEHRFNAHAHGLLFGAYFFYRFGKGAKDQAKTFLMITGGVGVGELPLVGDFEWNKNTKYAEGHTMDDAAANEALEFLERIEELSKITPIIYTSYPFFRGFKNPERFYRFHPWCPAYGGVPGPKVPLPWSRFAFWQYADQPPFAREITGDPHLDLNYFNGSYEDLKAMVKK